jgi:hypothetical protein
MTIFDLLFLLTALLTFVSMLVAGMLAITRRRAKALRLLRAVGIFILIYLVVSVAVAFFKPQRVLAIGNPWCFDDWCLAVDHMTERPAGQQVLYTFDLRIFSRARRVSQRAKGAWILVIDAQGRRYAPTHAANELPLDVLLAPLESRQTTRTFAVPLGAQPIGLTTGHGGGYCGLMNLLIIGNAGCLFGKPTMIGLSEPLSGLFDTDRQCKLLAGE